MVKRALFAVSGFLGLCLSLFAQQTQGTEQFQLSGSSLDRLSSLRPPITLDSQQFFFSTSFGWMQPTSDFLPTFNPAQPQSVASPNAPRRRDSVDNVADLRYPDRVYVGGEIGFLYGRSSGKYGIEYERGYVIGEIGNDKFHFTVGTSYERSSGRVPSWGR